MVSGDTTKAFKFFDNETGQQISVELTIKDGILLKLLEKINNSIERKQ